MDYQSAVLRLAKAQSYREGLQAAHMAVVTANDAVAALAYASLTELQEAQAMVGAAIVGIKSVLTQRAEAERITGISALIDAIKLNPQITPAAAQTVWVSAVAASITTPPLEDPVGIVSAIMVIAGCADWAAFCALIVAGNKPDLIAAVS